MKVEADVVVVEDEASAGDIARELENQRNSVLSTIHEFVQKNYECKKRGREQKKSEWLRALALYNSPLADNYVRGEAEDFFKDSVKQRDKPYPNIVRSRCKNVISQLIEGQFAISDKNWSLRPSPDQDEWSVVPDMYGQPMSILDASFRMEKEIEDQLLDCDYKKEYCAAISNFVILGSGILKGPTNSNKYRRTYVPEQTEDGSVVYITKIIPIPRPGIWNVDPWFFFPDNTTNDPCKMESTIEAHPFTKAEAQNLLNHEGFLPDQLREAIKAGPSKGEMELFDFIAMSDTTSAKPDNKYIFFEYNGPIPAEKLLNLGIISHDDDCGPEVMAEIWICNGQTVRVALPMLEGEYRPPHAVASYEDDPASVLGFGLPLLLESQQRTVKTTTGMLLDNLAISSGPQAVVDTTLITPAAMGGDYNIEPWKVWKKTDNWGDTTDVTKAMTFFDVPNQAGMLLSAIQTFLGFAEIDSGVSEMVGGLTPAQGGEGGATGFAIQDANSLTPLLFKQEVLIENLTKPCIEWMYHWNMQYNPRPDIKGDFEVDVRAPIRAIQSQKEKVELERLSMEAVNNPEMAAYIKSDVLTKYRLQGMNLPYGDIIRNEEERAAWIEEQQQQQGPDPALLKAEAEMLNAQTKAGELELANRQLDFDQQEGMRKAQMENMAYLENQETRIQEAQIRLLTTEAEREIALINLAAKSETDRMRIMADVDKNNLNQRIQLFLAGQDNALKAQQVRQTDEELALKRQGNTGV